MPKDAVENNSESFKSSWSYGEREGIVMEHLVCNYFSCKERY